MKNYVEKGEVINHHLNESGDTITSGSVVVIGDRIGIATGDIADDATGPLAVEGVFELPLAAAADPDIGDVVYWDVADGEINTDVMNTRAGYVFAKPGGGVIHVKID